MKIVITGGSSVLGTAAAAALRRAHDVTTLTIDPREIDVGLIGRSEALVHLDPAISDVSGSQDEHDMLDRCTRGTYLTLQAAIDSGVQRILVGSSLSLFDRYPGSWAISESWEPRPDVDDPRQLATYLLEQSARQFAFSEDVEVVGLRFGEMVDDRVAHSGRDWSWIHLDDAVQAIEKALAGELRRPRHGWRVYHIGGAGYTRVSSANARDGLGYVPHHDLTPRRDARPTAQEGDRGLRLLEPRHRIPTRPIRRVLILGGGGPLAAASLPMLAASHTLRVTDLRPIAEIAAAGQPQSAGAPLPVVPPPPHETMQVDITDLGQVMRACDGVDAIVNCTVVRPHMKRAFSVNCVGAYNVMKAAVARGIRRIVHTGPQQMTGDWPAAYGGDFHVPDDAPPRSGRHLYHHTKFLGQEIVRLFADQYDLEVPVLHFSAFVNPETAEPRAEGLNPMSVSWEDAGRAMCRAIEVPELPSPFEVFHIVTNLPHGKYSNRKAERVLGWRPRDDLQNLWAHRP